MEELDIREIFSYFWEKILYFIMIVLVVLILGCVYSTFIQKPMYTSKTSIILTGFTLSGNDSTITQTDLNVNSKLVSTYQEIVKSRRVLNQVIDDLKLNYSVEELAKLISVSSVSNTEIIEISAMSEDPNESYLIANKVAACFGEEVKDLYNLSNVSILDEAEVSNSPSNMNLVKSIGIYFLVGVVLACVILFIVFYFDTTLKSAQDIEKRYNLPILGTVPEYSKKKRGSRK